jgi:hypothetical protein
LFQFPYFNGANGWTQGESCLQPVSKNGPGGLDELRASSKCATLLLFARVAPFRLDA